MKPKNVPCVSLQAVSDEEYEDYLAKKVSHMTKCHMTSHMTIVKSIVVPKKNNLRYLINPYSLTKYMICIVPLYFKL